MPLPSLNMPLPPLPAPSGGDPFGMDQSVQGVNVNPRKPLSREVQNALGVGVRATPSGDLPPIPNDVQPVAPDKIGGGEVALPSLLPSRERARIEVEKLIEARKNDAARAAAADAVRKRSQAGNAAVGVQAGPPGAGAPIRPIGYTPFTPAHFEQAGNYYRGTPTQTAAIQNIMGANADQASAMETGNAAQAAHDERIAGVMDLEAVKARRANALLEAAQQQREADRAEAAEAVRLATEKHAKLAAPDPAEYWRGLGFAGSIGMIMANAMDTAGSAMLGRDPSHMIEKGIDRSLAMQQARIDKSAKDIDAAKGLYAQMRQSGLDADTAAAATKARRLEDAAMLVDSYQRLARNDANRAQLANTAAELRKKAAYETLAISEKIQGEGVGRVVAAQGGAPIYPGGDLKQRKALAEVQKAEAEAIEAAAKAKEAGDGGGGKGLSVHERQQTLATLAKLESAKETIEEARKNIPNYPEMALLGMPVLGGMLPAISSKKKASIEKVAMAVGETEPGTKSEADMQRYKSTMGYTPGVRYSPKVVDDLLSANSAKIDKAMAAERAALTTGQVTGLTARWLTEQKRQELLNKSKAK